MKSERRDRTKPAAPLEPDVAVEIEIDPAAVAQNGSTPHPVAVPVEVTIVERSVEVTVIEFLPASARTGTGTDSSDGG